MVLGRTVVMAFSFGAVLMAGALSMVGPAAAAGRVAPYCIATGGGGEGGGYRTSRCDFFDYQACIQAAAGGGNCVQNIDYHGEPAQTPAPSRQRRQAQ
jgi:hypothetical protein